MRSITVLLGLLICFSQPAALAQEQRTEIVRFPRGGSSATMEGTIRGRDSVRYAIEVEAGQRMSVQLDAANASSAFNITAPGASEALFNGSVSGASTSFVIPSGGAYAIDVYLMRNAARRDESADYALTIAVENNRGATTPTRTQPISEPQDAFAESIPNADMPRFCKGEASARFGVRPPEITTSPAVRSGGNHIVQGSFDGNGGTTFFRCLFSPDGRFVSVN